jgi:uncharacterized membrane protein YfcA
MTIIADPLFYLLAFPAILLLGLGKGGFAGVGMISTPLLALTMPPLQAAAILLPILLCQDVISVWAYRREWSAWNLKVLLPGSVVGVGAAWLFAAYVPNAYVEIAVGVTGVCFALYMLFRPRRKSRSGRGTRGDVLGPARGLHVDHHPGRRPALPGAHPAAAARQAHAHRHHHHLLRAGQRDEAVPYFAPAVSPETLATRRCLPFAIAANFSAWWLARHPTELFYQITYVLMLVISLADLAGADAVAAG